MRFTLRRGKIFAWLALALAAAAPAAESLVVSGIASPEGPLLVDGTLYFVSTESDALLRWDGKATSVVNHTPGCGHNGLALTKQGTFLVACMKNGGAILELKRDGTQLHRWAADDQGRSFAGGVNDFALAADGGVYATIFGPKDHEGGLLYRAPGHDGWAQVASGLNYANGLAVSADGKTLYVGESGGNRILAFPIGAGGKLGESRPFVALRDLVKDRVADNWLGPDGIKRDRQGNLFVAQYLGAKILKLSPQGRLLHVFDIAAGTRITNIAFSADESALFVTVGDCADKAGCLVRLANHE